MGLVHVQFENEKNERVVSVFSSPQNPDDWLNIGDVSDDDPRYLAYVSPESSPESILKEKQARKEQLLALAVQSMSPYLLAMQLGDASPAELEGAKAWRAYYVDLQGLDVNVPDVEWPVPPA